MTKMENQTFWCIVDYFGATPYYYEGYYKQGNGNNKMRPCITTDFEKALKLHTQQEAERVLKAMGVMGWSVEEHSY